METARTNILGTFKRVSSKNTKPKVEELYRITSQVLVAGQVRVHSIFFPHVKQYRWKKTLLLLPSKSKTK